MTAMVRLPRRSPQPTPISAASRPIAGSLCADLPVAEVEEDAEAGTHLSARRQARHRPGQGAGPQHLEGERQPRSSVGRWRGASDDLISAIRWLPASRSSWRLPLHLEPTMRTSRFSFALIAFLLALAASRPAFADITITGTV